MSLLVYMEKILPCSKALRTEQRPKFLQRFADNIDIAMSERFSSGT
jgi:hypothetical protein